MDFDSYDQAKEEAARLNRPVKGNFNGIAYKFFPDGTRTRTQRQKPDRPRPEPAKEAGPRARINIPVLNQLEGWARRMFLNIGNGSAGGGVGKPKRYWKNLQARRARANQIARESRRRNRGR